MKLTKNTLCFNKEKIKFYTECYLAWRSLREDHIIAVDNYLNKLYDSLSIRKDNVLQTNEGNSSQLRSSRDLIAKIFRGVSDLRFQYQKLNDALNTSKKLTIISMGLMRTDVSHFHGLRSSLKKITKSFDKNNPSISLQTSLEEDVIIVLEASHVDLDKEFISNANKENVFVLNAFMLLFCWVGILVSKPIYTTQQTLNIVYYALKSKLRDKFISLKHLLSILEFSFVYATLLDDKKLRIFNLTSNSILADSLKFYGAQNKNCLSTCEILHGVNHQLVDTYHRRLLSLSKEYSNNSNLYFINHIPEFPENGITSLRNLESNEQTINIHFNNFLNKFEFNKYEIRRNVNKVLSNLYTHQNEKKLIIGYLGYSDTMSDTTRRRSFELEKILISKILNACNRQNINYELIYSPHPAVGFEAVRKDIFFEEKNLKIFDSTMKLNFFSDCSFAILSGALFEARYFGSEVFSPLLPSESYWLESLETSYQHPLTYKSEDIENSLLNWIQCTKPLTLIQRKDLIERNLNKYRNWNDD